jgi:hypothetical protein
MAGYFKVSMNAAKEIVALSDGPELLAGYITLCGFAYGPRREITRAGAKAIRQRAGYTDHRSKRVLRELQAHRFGANGDQGLVTSTGLKGGNAAIYSIDNWGGEYAYLPSLLLDMDPEYGTTLAKIVQDENLEREILRDALLLLLHVYATVDYAEWFGCPPDRMAHQDWKDEGTAGDDFGLGLQGYVADVALSLVGEPDSWFVSPSIMQELYGDGEAGKARFWLALWGLVDLHVVVPVVSVQSRGRAYPLWIYNVAYRDSLRAHGIVPDLGREMQLAACASGLDPDNYVIRYAIDELDRKGSGLFFCAGDAPKVRTVLAPRLHAPTPINLDGMEEAARTTRSVQRQIRAARRVDKAA